MRRTRTASARGGRRWRIIAAGAVVTAALTVGVAQPASAYTLTGCHWGSSTITWTNSTTSAYSGSAVAAANSWASATDINGMGATGGQMKAYVANNGANGYEGLSDWQCVGNLLIGSNVTLNPYYTDAYSSAKKQAVWVHEFGHGMGLNHSASSAAIMWSSASYVYNTYGYNTPRSDDIAGMNSIY